ncbi:MAG: putative porin [Candidatus Omnitrophica bacterium]|nr:putative porin [Candidatus Omnitrophota bacterium]
MKKIVLLTFVGIVMALAFSGKSFAGEVDILVEKLVEKGVLSHGEAQQILTETKEEIRRELAAAEHPSVPEWVQKLKLSGDFRLRYQWQDNEQDTRSGRNRGRIRYRLGLETMVGKTKIVAGLASGGADPRSTNQTFQDTFSTKGINLDYAYLQYSPFSWMTLVGGKMERKPVLWEPTDLLWDGDINPEGGAMLLSHGLDENTELFMNSGLFVLDEEGGASDEPWMAFVQPGVSAKLFDGKVNAKAAVTGYVIQTKGSDVDNSPNTNSLNGTDHFYDYNSVSPAFEIGVVEPFGLVPYFGLFGEYVNSFEPSDADNGFAAGIKFGDAKVSGPGKWQFKYIYRRLERDAWLDALPDSDSYDGDTDIKGHEAILEFGLTKNITFGLDYYYMEPIDATVHAADDKQQVIQADLVFKF